LLFRLIPSAVIAGRILDEDGEPLPSVNVSAVHEIYHEGKRTVATSTVAASNDLGEYRLFGLPPGRYFITAVYPQWNRFGGSGASYDRAETEEHGYAKMFYPGTAEAAKAIPLTIKAGEQLTSIDILMRQVRVYHVRGYVYNRLTKKVPADPNVYLTSKNRRFEWDFGDQQSTAEKKDGSFDISEVLPGPYVLTTYWFDEGKPITACVPVDVGNADVDGIALTLGPGVDISGHIIWDGQPSLDANELNVAPKPADTRWSFWGASSSPVDPTNSFVLKDVGEGAYFAELYGLSKDCYIKELRYGPSSALDDGFTVTRSAPATLEITVSSRGARIQGTVSDEDGLSAAGVQVVLVPEDSRRTVHRLYKSGSTDQYGHFNLRGIPPGDYELFSWEEVESGAWEDPEFLKPFEDKGEKTSVQAGEVKNINLIAIRNRKPEATP
jgi:protocatechuate 3,4-dioxygenase beta subunit